MDRLEANLESIMFMLSWVKMNSTNIENANTPPPSLRHYQLINMDTYITEYEATFIKKEQESVLWRFRNSPWLTGKYKNLVIRYYNDGIVEKHDASGGSIVRNPYGLITDTQDDEDKFDDGFDFIRRLIGLNALCMTFLANFKPELKEYTETKVEHIKKKPGGKIRKKSHTQIALWRYTDAHKNEHITHRKCAYRFNVRGHYRHYKNGKIVFVKAYEKNRDKPTRKETVYRLPQGGGTP